MRDNELEEALKEFILRIRLQPYSAEKDIETLNRIEKNLIAFIISGYNYSHLNSWLRLLHRDEDFRERVKACFREYIKKFKEDIGVFEYGLETISLLGRHKPDWEEIQWRESLLISLERFLYFRPIYRDYE